VCVTELSTHQYTRLCISWGPPTGVASRLKQGSAAGSARVENCFHLSISSTYLKLLPSLAEELVLLLKEMPLRIDMGLMVTEGYSNLPKTPELAYMPRIEDYITW